MAFNRLSVGAGPNSISTVMGWNQVVSVPATTVTGMNQGVLRVQDYQIGSKQTPNVPDYVTGATDRTAYSKGPVEIEGTLSYPLTIEDGSGIVPGFDFFKAGAQLVENPTESFSIIGANGETTAGCKTQTCSISVQASEAITCSSTVWGVSDSTSNVSDVGGSHPTGAILNDGDAFGRVIQTYGEIDGADVSGTFTVVQIPMWDTVKVEGAPTGMFVTGVSIEINNNLQRNYTLGTESGASPWGLNATSISTGQRTITGTLTWQSDAAGSLAAILGTGVKQLKLTIDQIAEITLINCVWSAQPPRLSAGDRITCESTFTALGDQGIFDAMTIVDL